MVEEILVPCLPSILGLRVGRFLDMSWHFQPRNNNNYDSPAFSRKCIIIGNWATTQILPYSLRPFIFATFLIVHIPFL